MEAGRGIQRAAGQAEALSLVKIQHFFDEQTSTLSYVVHDGRSAVVIDPVRDYDPKSGRTSWSSADKVAAYLDREGLEVPYVIDTHAHADHLTGLPFFKERYGARTRDRGAGRRGAACVPRRLQPRPRLPGRRAPVRRAPRRGQAPRLRLARGRGLHTPGHTPAHMSWRIGDAVFLGDTLFMPDYGSARCDFPGGSAAILYDSIQRIYALPDETRLFVCHDYMPGGRPLAFETTVGEQKRRNVQIDERTTRDEYVAFREKRDAGLEAPALILPSIQVNIRAGALPEPEANGTSYLKIPLDVLGGRR